MSLSLQDYIAKHADDMVLSNAAGMILFSVDGLPYASQIQVLDEDINLSMLKPGYYLRFQNRGQGMFHLYGIEVIEPDNIIIHENIPRSQLSKHSDKLFLPQLEQFDADGRILFRIATTPGGGAELHEDLARQYALTGTVGSYLNSKLATGDKLPVSMADFSKKKISHKQTRNEPMDEPIKIKQLDASEQTSAKEKKLADEIVQPPPSDEPVVINPNQDRQERVAANTLMFAAGVFSASVGLGAIIVGALALASIISVFAPPVGIALIAGGAIALASGVGLCFFGNRNTKSEEPGAGIDKNLDLTL